MIVMLMVIVVMMIVILIIGIEAQVAHRTPRTICAVIRFASFAIVMFVAGRLLPSIVAVHLAASFWWIRCACAVRGPTWPVDGNNNNCCWFLVRLYSSGRSSAESIAYAGTHSLTVIILIQRHNLSYMHIVSLWGHVSFSFWYWCLLCPLRQLQQGSQRGHDIKILYNVEGGT